MKKRERTKKKNRTSLFCLFNFRSDVHERPKDSRYPPVCSGQRWRYQRKCAALLPKYETQISIVRFAGDVFTLNFAAGWVICYRCTPSILAPLWSLRVRLVEGLQRYEGGLFFLKAVFGGIWQKADFLHLLFYSSASLWRMLYTVVRDVPHGEKQSALAPEAS